MAVNGYSSVVGAGCLAGWLAFGLAAAEPPPLPELPPSPPSLPVPAARPQRLSPPVVAPPSIRPLIGSNVAGQIRWTAPPTGPNPGPVVAPPYNPALNPNFALVPGATNPLLPGSPLAPARPVFTPPQQERVFAWDALVKEYAAKPGELSARFTFSLTNITDAEVAITAVRTSCGCTVAKLPMVPWRIGAGSNGTFEVTVDLRGKTGILTKTVTIDSAAGYRFLTVRVSIPGGAVPSTTLADRARNLQMAMGDRQAVFKGECGTCHLVPAIGKQSEALYHAACGVCHEAEHRASMVPNLRAMNRPVSREFWVEIISKGRTNTLMPAWAVSEGGPLNAEQINSLADYLTGAFALRAKVAQPAARPAGPASFPTQ